MDVCKQPGHLAAEQLILIGVSGYGKLDKLRMDSFESAVNKLLSMTFVLGAVYVANGASLASPEQQRDNKESWSDINTCTARITVYASCIQSV